MDEWEGDGADAVDLNYDMTVVADAAHIAGIALEHAGGDAHSLAGSEVRLAVDLTALGI